MGLVSARPHVRKPKLENGLEAGYFKQEMETEGWIMMGSGNKEEGHVELEFEQKSPDSFSPRITRTQRPS